MKKYIQNLKSIKINDECFIYNKYILPKNFFEIEIFYDNYGIDNIKNLEKIKNKNIIDAGACHGDSALLFSYYTDKNVYAFEPLEKEYSLMLKTIELNNINNIIPVNLALGDCETEINMSGWNIVLDDNSNNLKKAKMTTLDKYVEENNINVGLIKTDLEGFEPQFLDGAINTIKKQIPVLIISIYHNYNDFFNIKPMLEELNLGYKFKIVKLTRNSIIVSTILIAEPDQPMS